MVTTRESSGEGWGSDLLIPIEGPASFARAHGLRLQARTPLLVLAALCALLLFQQRRDERDFDEPALLADTLGPLATDVHILRFPGLTPARVRVAARRGALTCALIDPAGAHVATGETDRCTAEWTPPRTGAYRLEITNTTRRRQSYRVVID